MQLSLIVAMNHHRVIGYQGKMPWHLPSELAYFKRMTLGKPVVMGHTTFASIGKPLPQRRNIVLSRQSSLLLPQCEVYHELATALHALGNADEVMVIGGASLYQQTLAQAQRLYLTIIDAEVEGDTFFPEWDQQQWRMLQQEHYAADKHNAYSFQTLILERKG